MRLCALGMLIVFGFTVATLTHDPVAASSASTIVRGKLYRLSRQNNQTPVAGIGVRLNHAQRGPSAIAYSGSDGLYYLYNVPPGKYVLEVLVPNSQPLKYNVEAKEQKYTDIAPIRVP